MEEEFSDVSEDEFRETIEEDISVAGAAIPPSLNRHFKDISHEDDDELQLDRSSKLFRRYILSEGFGEHHIDVYDHWIATTASHNICSRVITLKNGNVVSFSNLRFASPTYMKDGKCREQTPQISRKYQITYGSEMFVDAVLKNPAGEVIDKYPDPIFIGKIPIQLFSRECVLHGKSREELRLFGEDPNDPGGYFIVDGKEKVVLMQEQLAVNRILLIHMTKKKAPVARLTAGTIRGTVLIEIGLDPDHRKLIEIRLPSLRTKDDKKQKYKSVNVLSIFRLLGDDDPIETIKLFLKPESMDKCIYKLSHNLINLETYPDDRARILEIAEKTTASEKEKEDLLARIINSDLFPHLNNMIGPDGESIEERSERIAFYKLYLLAIMVAWYIEHLAGVRDLDDRDSWSNKRIEGAGRMMEKLLRTSWRRALGIAQAVAEARNMTSLRSVIQEIKSDTITKTFRDSFVKSTWGVKGTTLKNNVSQTLVRDSVAATIAHINTVDVSISRTDRQQSLRLVQNSQLGFIDPNSTTEGKNAGILKNLCTTTKVSLDRNDTDVIRKLIGDEEMKIEKRVEFNHRKAGKKGWATKLMVNGKFLGWCDGEKTRTFLLEERRAKKIYYDTTLVLNDGWLFVDLGASRPIRPLLIVNEKTQQLVIDEKGLRNADIETLLSSGAMEYLSPWEQEYIKLAPTEADIQIRLRKISDVEEKLAKAEEDLEKIKKGEQVSIFSSDGSKVPLTLEEAKQAIIDNKESLDKIASSLPYTHCEIDPQATVSVTADLITFIGFNQAPRNTYQVNMCKQALGKYHTNHTNRFDEKAKILAYPSRPMVETEMYSPLGLDERGCGNMVTGAFVALPYTEEDAFLIKKSFLDNGGMRMYKFLTYQTIVKADTTVHETLAKPSNLTDNMKERFRYIGENGLPMIGAPLRQGDCVIGKIQQGSNSAGGSEIRNESTYLRVGDEGVVDKVMVITNMKGKVVTVKLRIMRIQQEADKFAPRNAQKGTCGFVINDEDMPFTEDGISPDFITNPSQIPSRMTISYPMEIVASKHAAFRGKRFNASPFKQFNLDEIRDTLKEYGYDEYGRETMRSATTGRKLETQIFIGPVFFQSLKHHVKDKIQARSRGSVKPMTKQPPKGKGSRGGLRFGEMERDATISHGATSFLRERLMFASDAYQVAFCKNDGHFAINNLSREVPYRNCPICGKSNFGTCTIPFAAKLLIHLLGALGLDLTFNLISNADYTNLIFSNEEQQYMEYHDDEEELEDDDLEEDYEDGFADAYE